MGGFDSAWLKWGRGVTHAQALDAEIEQFAAAIRGQPVVRLVNRYDGRRRGFAVVVKDAPTLVPTWNLLLGDVITNFRASLDHLAWEVVRRGTTPELKKREANQIYFPISGDNTTFNNDVVSKLRGARRSDIAIIRRVQPYRLGKTRVQWHCLTLLKDMARIDKHREIHGLWMGIAGLRIKPLSQNDCVVIDSHAGKSQGLLRLGAEIGFIRARRTGPNPNITVEYEITAEPAFKPQLALRQWMDLTTITISRLLHEFSEPPDSLNSLGLDSKKIAQANASYLLMAKIYSTARGTPRVPWHSP